MILSREGDPLWGPYPDAPFYVTDVTGWRPGESVRVDAGTPGFPCPLDSIPRGGYLVRAIVDTNAHHWSSTWAPGNLFSGKAEILAGADTVLSMTLARQVPVPVFEETDRIREVVFPSRLVSDFAGAPRRLACAVVLPRSYGVAPERRYPTVYVVPGWGATRHAVLRGDHQQSRYGMEGFGEEKGLRLPGPRGRRGIPLLRRLGQPGTVGNGPGAGTDPAPRIRVPSDS